VSAAVAEPMIEAELWVSFVSMLQSYAAAASLSSEVANKVWVHVKRNTVTISAFAAQIEMTFDAASGRGTWEKRVAERSAFPGTFTIEPEGKIRINGAIREFDIAAIDLIDSVTKGGKEAW
jgi:hypothetical protein